RVLQEEVTSLTWQTRHAPKTQGFLKGSRPRKKNTINSNQTFPHTQTHATTQPHARQTPHTNKHTHTHKHTHTQRQTLWRPSITMCGMCSFSMAGEMMTSSKALLSPHRAEYVGSSCPQLPTGR